MSKIFFGAAAVLQLLWMLYTQGLAEEGRITLARFVICFLLQAAAFVLCLWQAGAFDEVLPKDDEKEKP